ncbi:unnamed protein product [Ixodes hexagonus]
MLPEIVPFSWVLVWTAALSSANDVVKSVTTETNGCKPVLKSTEIGDRATCTFRRVVDMDPTRIPPEIATVRCNCSDTLCTELGDFRCREVREKMVVSYVVKGSSALRSRTLEVTTACICAANRSVQAPGGGDRPARNYTNDTSTVKSETST